MSVQSVAQHCVPSKAERRGGHENRMSGHVWTEADDRYLQEQWNAGKNPRLIGAAIGHGVSRCSVLGRISRLRARGLKLDQRGPIRHDYKSRVGVKNRPAKAKPRHAKSQPPAASQPVFDFTDIEPTPAPQPRVHWNIAGLPRITPERIHARRAIELLSDETAMSTDLRCACGRPGTPHCTEHRAMLRREGLL